MLLKSNVEVVVKHTCLLGEGPVWDMKRQRILWIDILRGDIHEFYPEAETFNTFNVGQLIGSIAICTDGKLIAALYDGFALIDMEKTEVQFLKDPEEHLPNNRFNEGKCDPAGRFWAGTLPLSEDTPAGNVYALERDFSVTRKIVGVTISNGMAWSLDHEALYYIDTPTFEVVAYNYDKSDGSISNKRTVIKIQKEEGYPDGMTIDSEGMLWIGHWDGWQVIRWDPNTGKPLHRISLPVAKVTSCTFGGKNLQDLYITTARKELSEEELKQQPLAGSTFVIRNCGYTGLPAFEFRG